MSWMGVGVDLTEEEAEAAVRTHRADGLLALAPELILHVRSIASSGDSERGETLPEWSAPMRITATDDSDAVYVQLLNWVSFWSDALGVKPPAVALVAWANAKEAQGFRAGTSPEGASLLVRLQTSWLRIRRDEIVRHASRVAYEADLIEFLGELRGKYPLEQRAPRKASPRPCEVCGAFAVRAEWWGPDDRDVEVKCQVCEHVVEVEVEGSARKVLDWLPDRSM